MFLASKLKKPKENQCFWLRTSKNLRKLMFLVSNLKQPKENQWFWFRTLKNLREINVFGFEP